MQLSRDLAIIPFDLHELGSENIVSFCTLNRIGNRSLGLASSNY